MLLLAPTAAAVDCVLEGLDGRDGVCLARCLSAGERAEALPPGLRGSSSRNVCGSFREQTLPAARQASEEAVHRCTVRRNDEGIWAGLEDLARRRETLAEESRRLADDLGRLEAEIDTRGVPVSGRTVGPAEGAR